MVSFSVVLSGFELLADTETSAVVETTDVFISLFKFSSVQAVKFAVAKINVNISANLFFILSPSFQATLYSKKLKSPDLFAVI